MLIMFLTLSLSVSTALGGKQSTSVILCHYVHRIDIAVDSVVCLSKQFYEFAPTKFAENDFNTDQTIGFF